MGTIAQIKSTVRRKQIISVVTQILIDLSDAVILKGSWDPSGGTLPGTGKKGWLYFASANGTVGGFDINQGMQILFKVDDPGQTLSNYDIR